MQLTVTKNDSSETAKVDVVPDLTGQELLSHLIENGFLQQAGEGQVHFFKLERTGANFPPNMTLAEIDAKDGDVIADELRKMAA
jgi:hypothetical protein